MLGIASQALTGEDPVVTTFPTLTGLHQDASKSIAIKDYSVETIALSFDGRIEEDALTLSWAQVLRGYVNDLTVGFWVYSKGNVKAVKVEFENVRSNTEVVKRMRAVEDGSVVGDTGLIIESLGDALRNVLNRFQNIDAQVGRMSLFRRLLTVCSLLIP